MTALYLHFTRKVFIATSLISLLLLTSFITKAQPLNFSTSSCPTTGSMTVTVTAPGAGAPYSYIFDGCGTILSQSGQPATYTFTGIPSIGCFTRVTVTDNAGNSIFRFVGMGNILFPGVARVYTYPCGPGNYVVIPIGGIFTNNALYTLYAQDGITVLVPPQSSNVFPNVTGTAGDNFVVGIRNICGGESFAPVTLATSTQINGMVNCVCTTGIPMECTASASADVISGATYTWISPNGTIYNGPSAGSNATPDVNGVWQLSTTITTGACTKTLTNAFVLSNCLTHLPVKYNYVRASSSNCKAKVEWSTAQEDNIDRYEIETSTNGNTNWSKVSTTKAAGSSNTERQYSTGIPYDDAPVLFIRIKQIDIDGRFTYSTIVKVDMSCDEKADKISANPNPVNQNSTITVKIESSSARGKSYIVFTDVTGRQYFNKTVTINKSLNRYDFSVIDFPKGIYFAKIVSDDGSWQSNTVKIIIQ